ncbi:MAG: aspartate aminotransferase family protein [Steroidobacteraceae bacterium]|jgi:putrescine aminotransferase|nr:aspartate aminotransferase family protein [Steroidobacteraceae bacterium]
MSRAAPIADRATREWQELDSRHFLHPFTDFKALAAEGARIVTRAEGAYLYDSEGRQILDGMAGLWCVNIGYGRKELAEAAYRQMQELPYYNSFFKSANPPAIELARVLAGLTPPQFSRAFFTGSGSESNDTIVRMVRRYWDLMGEGGRKVIISRHNAYHGSTMAGASLGGMSAMHSQGGLPIPDIVHIEQPYWFENGTDVSPAEYGVRAARRLAEKIEEIGPGRVAAFIGEPIQGAGGVIIPPETYWPEIQRICRHYGILLIADEVVCGFGRTGRWFGCEYFGFEPDLMTLAKAITSGYQPLGAVMVSDRVADVLVEKGGEFFHGYTYSGHPVACAVALANLAILRDEGLVDRVREDIGPYLQQRWRDLGEHRLVGEARGVGMIGALELVAHKGTRTFFRNRGEVGLICRDHCFANGLVMRAVRDTMIISPPLVLSRGQVDELFEKAWRCLDLTARDIGLS